MFRDKYPMTWTFHQSTCRSELNTLQPEKADTSQDVYKEYLSAPVIRLPKADIPSANFSELLFQRYSCRRFTNAPISLRDMSNLLFAAYGKCSQVMLGDIEFIGRTVPSGGGLYPLEFYTLAMNVEQLDPGIYHYVITPGILEMVKKIQLPKSFLQNLFMDQPYVADAPLIIIATAVIERTMKKYFDRGYRYLLLEAGHAFQNMNLASVACGLGSMNIGGFFDTDLCKVLGIDIEDEIPLYAMAAGNPAADNLSGRIPDMSE